MTSTSRATDVHSALDRAEAYRFFASMLRYPVPEELRADLAAAKESSRLLRGWADSVSAHINEELAAEHNRLFAQGVAVSPHESSYALIDKGVLLGQLAALYECLGVRTGGTEYATADHAGVELEFMALLCLKEALYLEEESAEAAEALATVRAVRHTFLQDHLGRFVPLFATRLRSGSRHPFFRELASQLMEWMAAEARTEGIVPDGISHHKLPVLESAEDTNAMSCPWASGDGLQPDPSITPIELRNSHVVEDAAHLPANR